MEKPTKEQLVIMENYFNWLNLRWDLLKNPKDKEKLVREALINAILDATKEAKVIKP
jgi:hypothetical protein